MERGKKTKNLGVGEGRQKGHPMHISPLPLKSLFSLLIYVSVFFFFLGGGGGWRRGESFTFYDKQPMIRSDNIPFFSELHKHLANYMIVQLAAKVSN